MFIKANKTKVNGKEYTNFLLVESVKTPKGPRHNVVCSLGNLKSAPREHWHQLAQKIERALEGQLELPGEGKTAVDEQVSEIIQKIKSRDSVREEQQQAASGSDQIDVDRITVEEAREAGPVHVCHQMWLELGMNKILKDAGFDERACALTEMLTINRLVEPGSESATRQWVPKTALPDMLGKELCELGATTLYTQLDRIHPLRSKIESALVQAEQDVLKLSSSIFLYDLTSTYFEGQCSKNDQAQHGYSRDQRPDCKQVVLGLVLSVDRFPLAHEVFDGNRTDSTTMDEMMDILDARTGGFAKGRTAAVDRGLSSKENLATLRERGYHYIVATRQQERDEYLAEIESDEGWQHLFKVRKGKFCETILNEIRIKRLSNEAVAKVKQKKLEATRVKFSKATKAAETAQDEGKEQDYCVAKSLAAVELSRELTNATAEAEMEEHLIICISKGRSDKDRAIREKQEKKFVVDAKALVTAATKLKPAKVHERIGRLKERYSRVARYYDFIFDEGKSELSISENADRKALAKELDGSYIIRTDRNDLTDLEVWQTYMMLTRVESAFRDMKSPLMERPIFHQLERRVQTHIFLCVLAYHLLAAIEKKFRDRGIATSWETLREVLRTHQVVTVVMPFKGSNKILRLRRGTSPEPQHIKIYDVLGIPHEPIQPQKSWTQV
jgi:transposase